MSIILFPQGNTLGRKSALATSLLCLLTAGLKWAGGSLASFGSNLPLDNMSIRIFQGWNNEWTNLLISVHISKAARVAGLSALGGNLSNLLLGAMLVSQLTFVDGCEIHTGWQSCRGWCSQCQSCWFVVKSCCVCLGRSLFEAVPHHRTGLTSV
jgi:hypothetical protein